jgi:hypothetical protein
MFRQHGEEAEVFAARKPYWNCGMNSFGNGPTLREACAWLRDDAERQARILDVTERNSVIEGLPPFDENVRQEILEELRSISRELAPAPPESPRPSAGNPS